MQSEKRERERETYLSCPWRRLKTTCGVCLGRGEGGREKTFGGGKLNFWYTTFSSRPDNKTGKTKSFFVDSLTLSYLMKNRPETLSGVGRTTSKTQELVPLPGALISFGFAMSLLQGKFTPFTRKRASEKEGKRLPWSLFFTQFFSHPVLASIFFALRSS